MRVVDRVKAHKFWVVWSPEKQVSRERFNSFAAAYTEAERISIEKGCTFYVLEAKQAVGIEVITNKTVTFFS